MIFIIIIIFFIIVGLLGVLNYGWLHLNNSAFQVPFENSDFSGSYKNFITPLPTDKKIGFTYGETNRTFKVMNVRFRTQVDAEAYLANIQTLQGALVPYKLEWQVNSGGGVGDFFKFDGVIAYMMVLCKDFKGISKAPGDQEIYYIRSLTFLEAQKL